MGRKKTPPKTSADILCGLADSFNEVGIAVTNELLKKENVKFLLIAPAAVNISMSIELYLKALHILYANQQPPDEHNLWTLYKYLPRDITEVIDLHYTVFHSQQKTPLKSFRFIVGPAERKNTKEDTAVSEFKTVKELLVNHARAFEQFRYLHEFSENGYNYEFDFDSINTFYIIIKRVALEAIDERKQKPDKQ